MDLGLVPGEPLDAFWRRLADQCADWLAAQGVSPRDAVLLLPFAQQLKPARRAWAARGSWQPVLATTHSLASALGPTALAAPGQISGDAPVDALAADALLARQSWAQSLKREDPRAYRLALARLVEAAHAFARAAGQRSPPQRAAYFEAARQQLAADQQPGDWGGTERALALVALAWAAADERQPATDTLFQHRPGAWIALQVGGPDPLAEALLAAAAVPALRLNADLDLDTLARPTAQVDEAQVTDFEALAQASAAAVLQHLAAGRMPVALIAQDRVVVRRVRALLSRQGLPLHDETGWTLATTPAASTLMALLRAALGGDRGGAVDDWLAWLKLSAEPSVGLDALEAYCRRHRLRRADTLDGLERLPAAALWHSRRAALAPLAGGPRMLADWLQALRRALGPEPLAGLEGGADVLEALWLSRNPWPGSAHEAVLDGVRLDGAGFLAWVSEVLEAGQFVPQDEGGAPVVITPLVRAMLRPFGALVLPGADADTLGRAGRSLALFSEADALALQLPTPTQQREAETQAFAQALRAPRLTLLRCTRAGSEPLPASPLLDRLAAAARRAGAPLPLQPWADPRQPQPVTTRPTARAVAARGPVPAALSASAIESLRRCPYQFFSRHALGLHDADELDAELEKRDYGTWLHAVLHHFHAHRQPGDPATQLRAAAAAQPVAEEDFLPWRASFERLLPRYLDWLAAAEAQGQAYAEGELARECQPFEGPLAELLLRGRIDRIDTTATGQSLLLDYKTGSLASLKAKVAEPLEDAQLAVYALLMGAGPDLAAAYLALDDPAGVVAVAHPDISETAMALLDGLQADLLALQGGAPLPALGEGSACEHCEARGLCRKDDWMAP
jgi:ATP-dependent helicase/nuclease subunit B